MTQWIITAIILPIPVVHLWFHALLPRWRKRPFAFYALGVLPFAAAVWIAPRIDTLSPSAFTPSEAIEWIGFVLIALGVLLIISSIAVLGPKRFFLWAVLRPESVPAIRITKGPFRVISHPAYIGYLIVALGNLLTSGKLYLAGVLFFLLALTPIVIWIEEEELKKRTGA